MIRVAGRTDVEEYFKLSGVCQWDVLKHTPLLVFVQDGADVEVRIVKKPKELLAYPDETLVMSQWAGRWSSEFFQFTVGQIRPHIEAAISQRSTNTRRSWEI